jgi:hypothetical protein
MFEELGQDLQSPSSGLMQESTLALMLADRTG